MNIADLSEFLDALIGVAYVTDPTGIIVAYGARNWDQFARANGGPELVHRQAVIGRSVLDLTVGEEVRSAYRGFMAALADGRARSIEFPYRCDGPETMRSMRMSITALGSNGAMKGYLFHSTTLGQVARAPLPLFAFRHGSDGSLDDRSLAVVHMCSFCQRVCLQGRAPSDPQGWVGKLGADQPAPTDFRVNHTICPACDERWVTSVRAATGPSGMTRRQRDVLVLLVRGYPNKTICAKLEMSPNTVKTHLRSIFRRLGVRTRAEATREVLRRWPDLADAEVPD